MIAAVDKARGSGTLRLPAGPTQPPSLQSPSPTQQQPQRDRSPDQRRRTIRVQRPYNTGAASLYRRVGGAHEPADNRGCRSTLPRALPANHVAAPPENARDQCAAAPTSDDILDLPHTALSAADNTREVLGPPGLVAARPRPIPQHAQHSDATARGEPLGRRLISIAAIAGHAGYEQVRLRAKRRHYRAPRQRHRPGGRGRGRRHPRIADGRTPSVRWVPRSRAAAPDRAFGARDRFDDADPGAATVPAARVADDEPRNCPLSWPADGEFTIRRGCREQRRPYNEGLWTLK